MIMDESSPLSTACNGDRKAMIHDTGHNQKNRNREPNGNHLLAESSPCSDFQSRHVLFPQQTKERYTISRAEASA